MMVNLPERKFTQTAIAHWCSENKLLKYYCC